MIYTPLTVEYEYEYLLSKFEAILSVSKTMNIDLSHEIQLLEQKMTKCKKNSFQNPTVWQKVLMNRDYTRPKTGDYINALFDNWIELHGDRYGADDPAVIGGIGCFEGLPITIVGYRKGKDTKENLQYNFGMPSPEGFRKIQRLVVQAEKFNRPVLAMIDTSGAHPGVSAEERGQAWAISNALATMCQLRVPIVSVVTGEGGGAGALVLAVCDRLLMLSNAVFSIVSPEVCSQILWKGSDKLEEVACAMKMTSTDLRDLGLIDEVIEEPIIGSSLVFNTLITRTKKTIKKHLSELLNQNINELLDVRYKKFRSIGVFKESEEMDAFSEVIA